MTAPSMTAPLTNGVVQIVVEIDDGVVMQCQTVESDRADVTYASPFEVMEPPTLNRGRMHSYDYTCLVERPGTNITLLEKISF